MNLLDHYSLNLLLAKQVKFLIQYKKGIYIWDINNKGAILVFETEKSPPKGIIWSPKGDYIGICSQNRKLNIYKHPTTFHKSQIIIILFLKLPGTA